MTTALIWISGASGGIGQALVRTVPWDGARVIGINRQPPKGSIEHLEADLADPSTWPAIGESFRREMKGFDGETLVFIHAAGTVEPQEERGDTALQVLEDRPVGDTQVRVGVLLAEVPAGQGGPERPGTADEWREPREPVGVALAGPVAAGVNRLDVDAFVGVGDELLLERRPFQVGLGQLAPLGVVGRREVVLDGEFGG